MKKNPETFLSKHPSHLEQVAIKELVTVMSEALQKGFIYGGIRGTTLVLHFKHPALVQEFALKKEEILSQMRLVYQEKQLRKKIVFTQIQAEHEYVPRPVLKPRELPFEERAKGEFENCVGDAKLSSLIEDIRNTIKNNANGESRDDS